MKKIFTLLTIALTAVSISASELTVANGTATSEHLPIYGFYADAGFENQFIYPASLLTDMAGKQIQSLLFYSSKANVVFPDAEVTIRLSEVDYTTLSGLVDASGFTVVYKGQFEVANSTLEFNFSESYEYKGGNLLVDVYLSKPSSKWPSTEFYGISSSGSGYNTYKVQVTTMGYVRDFLPKATFGFEISGGGACANPTRLKGTATPDGAVFTWNGAEDVKHQYCIVDHEAEVAAWNDLDANVFTFTATGLEAGKSYDFCLRADCGEEQSEVVREAFTPTCYAPANLQVAELRSGAASFAWDAVAGISKYQYVCVREGNEPAWDGVEAKEGVTATVSGLESNTAYDFYVRSFFNDNVQSGAVKVNFTSTCVKNYGYKSAFATDGLPACWENTDIHGISEWTVSEGAVQWRSTNNVNNHATLVSPWFTLPEDGDPCLLFDWMNTGADAKVSIEAEGAAVVELADLSEVSAKFATRKFHLSEYKGQTVHFLFYAGSVANVANKYAYLDNFQVAEKPLLAPTDLAAEAAVEGATLSWTAGWDELNWDVQYKKSADAEWILLDEIADTPLELTNLEPGVEYEAQVRANYADDKQSAWTESVYFTPLTEGGATAVELLHADKNARKRIVNGQLVIEHNGHRYNVLGAELK